MWINAVIYHAGQIHMHNGFFEDEASAGIAVENILELTGHKTIYPEMLLQVNFIAEIYQRLVSTMTSLEATHGSLAVVMYNIMCMYFESGATKNTFGSATDKLLEKVKGAEKVTSIS